MTQPRDPRAPRHRDMARAFRGGLAALDHDLDAIAVLAAEAETPEDVDRFLLACLTALAALGTARLKDPRGYFQSAIAVCLEQADAEECADVDAEVRKLVDPDSGAPGL